MQVTDFFTAFHKIVLDTGFARSADYMTEIPYIIILDSNGFAYGIGVAAFNVEDGELYNCEISITCSRQRSPTLYISVSDPFLLERAYGMLLHLRANYALKEPPINWSKEGF